MYFENFRKPESDFKSSFNHHQLRTLSELFCIEEQFPNANHTLHSEVLNLQQRLFPISFKHFHPAQLLVAKTAVTLMSVYNDNLRHCVTNKLVPRDVLDQPEHPPTLIRVCAVRIIKKTSLAIRRVHSQYLSDRMDSQADLSFCWTQSQNRWFCHAAAHF